MRAEELNLLKLKNGVKEPEVAITATMVSLRSLFDSDPIAIYELTMLCRNRNHTL